MRPISYEIKRTLTSKFVVLMIAAIIGLSALLAYESAASYNSPSVSSNTPDVTVGYYESGSNITVVTYSYNIYGLPYKNLDINVFSQQGKQYSIKSADNGFANVTFAYNSTSKSPVSYNYTYSTFARTTSVPKSDISVNGTFSGYSITPGLVSSKNASSLGFQIIYVGASGSTAPSTQVSVATSPESGNTAGDIINNATYTENVSGFNVRNVFPSIPPGILNKSFAVVLTTSSIPVAFHILPRLSTYTKITQSRLQTLVFTGMGPILGFLIPILGVFAAYLTYGKDRTTGVLESVLKRPVTRQGLISSRFVANSVSIIISVIVAMIVGDLIIEHYFGMGLTAYFMGFFIWTYVVEGIAFLGLIYMFTHMVKSQGSLLGVSIAVFVVLALFWSIIPATILLALNISPTSALYIYASVAFNYASPSGYQSLVQFHFTNGIGFIRTISANPAAYGVTPLLLIMAGILWIAVPFGIAYYLARKYD